MEVSSAEKEYNSEFVLMPWDDRTKILIDGENNAADICSRWEVIQRQLNRSISNVDDLINMIRSYNVVFDKEGKQTKPYWKCLVLRQYFSQLTDLERKQFFLEDNVFSTIRNLALQLKDLLPKLKILKTGFSSSVKLHQLQIASILANAFLCTFPPGKADCPSINFITLYEGVSSSVLKYNVEKVKCIVHYFKRVHNKQPTGNLSFHRLSVPDHKFPRWDKTTTDLCSLRVDIQGKIEDQEGYLQMDFANRYVGGGVLGRGCVQEEIRFVICPELIAARLFTESLADNEALFIIGAERYCRYSGYSNTFTFTGDYQDTTPFDENRHRKTYLIVVDALYFHHSSDQYRESKILRELKKAYVGFKLMEENYDLPLATGNWGCGAFGGDPQLKSILQIMASSQAQRDMLYLTFGDSVLKTQIEELYQLLKNKAVNVGMLYRIIRLYSREKRKNQTVFEFITASLSRPEKRKFSSKSITPPSSSQSFSSAFESPFLTSIEKGTRPKYKIEKREPREILDDSFPHLNIDFNSLDKLVRSNTLDDSTSHVDRKSLDKHSSLASKERHFDSERENFSILDIMWPKNECNFNPDVEERSEEQTVGLERDCTRNSPSLFSEDEEMEVDIERTESVFFPTDTSKPQTNQPRNIKTTSFTVNETATTQSKKLLQSKITDCFFKK